MFIRIQKFSKKFLKPLELDEFVEWPSGYLKNVFKFVTLCQSNLKPMQLSSLSIGTLLSAAS